MTRRGTEDNRGFSLMELVVTLGIVGVLSSIAIPTFLGLQHKVKVRAMEETVRVMTPEISHWMNSVENEDWGTVDFNCDGVLDKKDFNQRAQTIGKIGNKWRNFRNIGKTCEQRSPFFPNTNLFANVAKIGKGQVGVQCFDETKTCLIQASTDRKSDGIIVQQLISVH